MKIARALMWGWIALISLYLLWLNVFASGIANWLLEWQYADIGWFHPTVTYFGMTLIAGIPAVFLFLLYWRARSRRQADRVPPTPVEFAARQFKLLLALASVTAAGAVISLLLLMTLPPTTGPTQTMPGDLRAMTLPTGPVRIAAFAPTGPPIRFTRHLLWTENTVRYLPLSGGARRGTRLFVQVDDSGIVPSEVSGVVAENALPPSVRNLFIFHGITAPGPHYVLFTQPSQMRRPYLLAALQFAVAGLLVLLAAGLQWRNLRRARRAVEGIEATAAG